MTDCQDPRHNLALEKHLMDTVGDDELRLFLWRNERTVVIGRNQNIWREVDVDRLLSDGGTPVRRLSGGGAVYQDAGNLNFTFCSTVANSDIPRQTSVILAAVASLGFNASKTGRNDLCIDGRKFSGHSYYMEGDRCFHNGTVLVDTDVSAMDAFLTVDPGKLQSKGVDSVRSRTVNLSRIIPVSVEEVGDAILKAFSAEYGTVPSRLDPEEEDFRELVSRFSSEEWTFNPSASFTETISLRRPDGAYELRIDVRRGVIEKCEVYTDSLDPDAAEKMKRLVTGKNRKTILSL